jgi:hypothetical protein
MNQTYILPTLEDGKRVNITEVYRVARYNKRSQTHGTPNFTFL